MNIRLFYHSLLSDWNHGNAHFLRGICRELQSRGHDVRVFEPANSWSLQNLLSEYGEAPLEKFRKVYPGLESTRYDLADFDLAGALEDADLVIVHEWSDRDLVRKIGELRAQRDFVLLFHDTHHRLATAPEEMHAYDLSNYDGVLAYGEVLRARYLKERLARRAWTWHEAADTRVFYPRRTAELKGDLVWIGNWGDEERTAELHEFLIQPVKTLRLKAKVYGVRYPESAKQALAEAGIEYGGWLPNFEAPEVFAGYRVTVHVPRRPYVNALPGIPTIRPFEALACGIPLITSPWEDSENLFTEGKDFLVAQDGAEMTRNLQLLLTNEDRRKTQAAHGLETILARHTCAHRVDELLCICGQLQRLLATETARKPAPVASGAGEWSTLDSR